MPFKQIRHFESEPQKWDFVSEMLQELFGSSEQTTAQALLHGSTEGAPTDAAQATLTVNPAGDDNALTFTAFQAGEAGNDITIAYLDPGEEDAELSISVNGSAIAVNLATDGNGDITTTAAEIADAIGNDEAADALVGAVVDAGDSGTEDDGSGVVTAMAAAPLTGGADGTAAGTIVKGGLLSDTENGLVYRNAGTLEAPEWILLADD